MIVLIVCIVLFFAIFGFGVLFGAPYVPSLRKDAKRMFDTLYQLKPTDVVIDFGSGDGLILREVSRRGACAVGYEVNPFLVAISKFLSRRDPNVAIHTANFWQVKFPKETTLIYAFSVTRDGKRLVQKLQREADRLRKDLAVICYGSQLPGMIPVQTFEAYGRYKIEPLHHR